MDTEIMVEPLPTLGVCNLCAKYGVAKSMILTHTRNKSKETYVDMLYKCFAIDLNSRDLGDMKPLICAECKTKLRCSMQFKEQVENTLNHLEQIVKSQLVKKEVLKDEQDHEDIVDDVIDDPDYDYAVDLQGSDADDKDLNIKKEDITEAESSRRSPRKRRAETSVKKLEKYPPKKFQDLHETESLVKSGLFPFKIRKDNMYSCAVCSKKSQQLDEIKSHVQEHNVKLIHIAFKKMLRNMQRFYKAEDKLRCKLCLTDITDYENLKEHLNNCERLNYGRSTWNLLPFTLEKDQTVCPLCKKQFLNYVNLNNHMNEHYPNYICENCGKAFASKGRLRGHIRTHEIGEFPCRYCHLVFDKVTKRENHVSKEHKAGVRYACKRCNITLPSFYARQKHLAEIHNEELKRYKCKACEQSYITPGHLSSHVRRDHLNERNHKCSKCDLAFYSKNSLKMHMIKHDGERIHTCPICQKSYQRKKTLREHLRIHNNDKRFVCPVCGRAFTQKCTLKGHLKVHEKKYDVDDAVIGI